MGVIKIFSQRGRGNPTKEGWALKKDGGRPIFGAPNNHLKGVIRGGVKKGGAKWEGGYLTRGEAVGDPTGVGEGTTIGVGSTTPVRGGRIFCKGGGKIVCTEKGESYKGGGCFFSSFFFIIFFFF